MFTHLLRFPTLRTPLALAAGLAALVAPACGLSNDPPPPEGNAASDASLDGGVVPDAQSRARSTDAAADARANANADAAATADADAAVIPSPHAKELARMRSHLDSLYLQTDVEHRFTTAYGDDVDCVPFQKQPGFARVGPLDGAAPVLEAPTTFQGKYPIVFDGDHATAGFGDGVDDRGRARSCPGDAVPIRRLALAELSRFATLEDFFRKAPRGGASPAATGGDSAVHEHATYRSSIPNWGAQTTLALWDPVVEAASVSLSQLWVARGTDDDLQSVEAGYTADRFRKDNAESRMFIYATAGNYKNPNGTDCYDLTCKAFVQVAGSHVLLGGKFDHSSIDGRERRDFTLRWQFCPSATCKAWEGWWLRYDGGTTSEWVGFYPRAIFSEKGLRDRGDRIEFGGEVDFVAGHAHTATQMGTGQPPSARGRDVASQYNLLRITTENSWDDLADLLIHNAEAPTCYDSRALNAPRSVDASHLQSISFSFGGVGYSAACK